MKNFSVRSRSRLFQPGAGVDPRRSEPESAPGPWPSGAGAAQKCGGSATLGKPMSVQGLENREVEEPGDRVWVCGVPAEFFSRHTRDLIEHELSRHFISFWQKFFNITQSEAKIFCQLGFWLVYTNNFYQNEMPTKILTMQQISRQRI